MGKYKWHRLKMDYTLEDAEPPPVEAVERALAVFRSKGLKAV
jgi:pyruvate formate lyase activating enzyme